MSNVTVHHNVPYIPFFFTWTVGMGTHGMGTLLGKIKKITIKNINVGEQIHCVNDK